MEITVRPLLNDMLFILIRCILAYVFFTASMDKLADIDSNVEWFKSINIPNPMANVLFVGVIEWLGAILLLSGLFVRITSLFFIVIMIVAIFTVHIGNGYSAANNGYEINLYCITMLLILLVNGPRKYSLDYFIYKWSS